MLQVLQSAGITEENAWLLKQLTSRKCLPENAWISVAYHHGAGTRHEHHVLCYHIRCASRGGAEGERDARASSPDYVRTEKNKDQRIFHFSHQDTKKNVVVIVVATVTLYDLQ
jgi:hypothetical protein